MTTYTAPPAEQCPACLRAAEFLLRAAIEFADMGDAVRSESRLRMAASREAGARSCWHDPDEMLPGGFFRHD